MPSKHLLALMLGTLSLGIAEFSMMSILSIVATNLNVTIPQAGHFIASYAIGVCFGVILMVLVARDIPLKKLILIIATFIFLGNSLTVFAQGYYSMLAARFISGLPHGAFFGVGSIIASQLAKPGHESRDVCLMVAGMTIANLIGVPLASFLSWKFSWRIDFALISIVGLILVLALNKLIPNLAALPNNGFWNQFKFLTHFQPWLILIAIALGNGGFFAFYSYVNPIIKDVSLISPQYMSIVITLAGLGMVLGNLLSAKLSLKISNPALASIGQAVLFVSLALIFFFAHSPIVAILLTAISAGCVFFIGGPEQVMMLKNAKDGQLLAAALAQCAFNAGNALGAWVGGLPIKAGKSAEWASLPGTVMALIGFLCLFTVFSIAFVKSRELPSKKIRM